MYNLKNYLFYKAADESETAADETEEVVEETEEVVEEVEEEKDPAQVKQEAEDKLQDDQDVKNKDDIAEILDISPEELEKHKDDKKEDEKEETAEEIAAKLEGEDKEEKEEKVEEVDPLLIELVKMSETISNFEKGIQVEPPKKDEKEEGKVEKAPAEEKELVDLIKTPVNTEDIVYLKPEDFKESLNAEEVTILNTTVNKAVAEARASATQQAIQSAMKIFPAMIDYKIQGFMAATEFMNINPDIKKMADQVPQIKSFIQTKAAQIQKANPNKTLVEVYKQTEKEVRQIIGEERLAKFKTAAGSDPSKIGGKPALPRKPGGGKKPVKKQTKETPQQAAFSDLIDFQR